MILAIDPGINTGWAVLSGGTLLSCGLGTPPFDYLKHVHSAIIEKPCHRPGSPVRVNDLITLAIQVGKYTEALESRGIQVSHVLPQSWKGSVPKEIHNKRVLSSLSPAEKSVLAKLPKSTMHNVLDAIGLGKYCLTHVA